MFKQIFRFFIVWKILIVSCAILAIFIIPMNFKFTSIHDHGPVPYIGWIWANFDGYHYISISKYGYGLHQNPFMPLYPLLIKIISELFKINHLWGALLISNCSFLLSIFIISKCIYQDKLSSISLYIFLSIILFPTSQFYGAAYNDALFFLLASLTIYFSRTKKWLYASIAGSFATLARLNGLALFPYLIVEYILSDTSMINQWSFNSLYKLIQSINAFGFIKHNKQSLTKHKQTTKTTSIQLFHFKQMFPFLLIPLSFLLYLSYTHIVYGDWNLVFSSMKAWQQDKITLPLQVVYRYIKILATFPLTKFEYWIALLELSSVIGYVYLLAFAWKKIRVSYWLFFFLSILIPSLTGSFQGMPRYGLHIYPMFITLGIMLNKSSKISRILFILISILLILFFTGYFTRGWFVA
jgi:Gpi18-like mannosyltransferase